MLESLELKTSCISWKELIEVGKFSLQFNQKLPEFQPSNFMLFSTKLSKCISQHHACSRLRSQIAKKQRIPNAFRVFLEFTVFKKPIDLIGLNRPGSGALVETYCSSVGLIGS